MTQQIIELLDELHIRYRWLDHPAVFSVRDATLLGHENNPIKNLLLQDEKTNQKYLVIMPGDKRLNMKTLASELSAKKLRFASNGTLLETFGVAPGSVSIFGLLHPGSIDTEVIIDEDVLNSNEDIGFHPNDNTATILISPQSIEPILQKIGCKYSAIKLND